MKAEVKEKSETTKKASEEMKEEAPKKTPISTKRQKPKHNPKNEPWLPPDWRRLDEHLEMQEKKARAFQKEEEANYQQPQDKSLRPLHPGDEKVGS